MKTAIVTGGSRGLGRDMALQIAGRGTDVILTYHSKQDEAQEVVAQIEAMGRQAVAIQLDTGDIASFDAFADEVKGALEKMGREKFDFLVNNAGVGVHASLAETTEEQFDSMVNIHFKGVYFLTQKLLPLMNDGGRIVNVSSGLARFSFPGWSAYGACKGAIETLTRYMAAELGPRGIAANVGRAGRHRHRFSAAALRATTKSFNKPLPVKPRWAASVKPKTSAALSPRFCPTKCAGLTGSASKFRAECCCKRNTTMTNKIALITGANKGIGLETARQLARDHGFYRSAGRARRTARHRRGERTAKRRTRRAVSFARPDRRGCC